MTSDGISSEDWERVQDAALEYVAETAEDCSDADDTRSRLLRLLDELEAKYGRLPSIVATRADYCSSIDERIQLLMEAMNLARGRGDTINEFEVADSLASTMIRKTRDAEAAKQWLRVMEALLLSEGGEDRLERYSGLAEELVVLEKELKP